MRVGSIGFATRQGIGLLLKDFYDHGIVTDVLPLKHGRFKNLEWYGLYISDQYPFREFLINNKIGVMLFIETPFLPNILKDCRELGVKTVLIPMYECTPAWITYRDVDRIWNPSLLDLHYYPQGQYIPIPVPDWVKWKQRTEAKVFVHNAGHLGLYGRNGTRELIKAIPLIKSPIKLIIRTQNVLDPLWQSAELSDIRVDLRLGEVPREELYNEGDVFVFPDKFNGLSLPLQEAMASGMVVAASDRYPHNSWLPSKPLIPVKGYSNFREPPISRAIQKAEVSPVDIAATIDRLYGSDIRDHSLYGKQYREERSWNSLKKTYVENLENLLGE